MLIRLKYSAFLAILATFDFHFRLSLPIHHTLIATVVLERGKKTGILESTISGECHKIPIFTQIHRSELGTHSKLMANTSDRSMQQIKVLNCIVF